MLWATSRFLFLAAGLAATPAVAQNPWEDAATIHQALARAIADALPREENGPSVAWAAVRFGGGRDVSWPLFTPAQARETAAEDRQERNGHISVNGAGGEILLCGDRVNVEQIDVRINDIWRGDEDIPDLLRRRGLSVTLIENQPHRPLSHPGADDGRTSDYYRSRLDAQPALQRWRLEAPQRLPVTLTARHGCTPPGTRSATQCATLWSLRFAVADAAENPSFCLGLGRYGSRDVLRR